MSKLHVKYLIVGGGVAASAAAEAIRGRDSEGAILLVTQESTRPYFRPPLSKEALRDRRPRGEFFTHSAEWFTQNQVELRTGKRAVHLDTARQTVALADGQEISFDKLLIASGATARHLVIPGHDLPGVHYLRTFDDLERLLHALDKAKNEGQRQLTRTGRGRVAVIGSGLLAVELAASLTQMGLEAELLLRGQHAWSKFAGEAVGKWIGRHLEQNGVSVRPGGSPLRLEGDGRVQRVVLPSMEVLTCDVAIAAIGVAPNRDLLRGTPIAAERAILTDQFCRTSDANVYAAGDCAAIFDPLFGKHRMLDHNESAAEIGALAGRNMAGANEAYASVNYFTTEIFGAIVRVWGESRHVHHRLVRGAGQSFVEFGLTAGNRISQVVAVNHDGDADALRELVKQRQDITGREEQLKEPGVELAELLR